MGGQIRVLRSQLVISATCSLASWRFWVGLDLHLDHMLFDGPNGMVSGNAFLPEIATAFQFGEQILQVERSAFWARLRPVNGCPAASTLLASVTACSSSVAMASRLDNEFPNDLS